MRPEFEKVAQEFVGKPIVYVEVGCWVADSADFVCRHILTHPNSIGIGIDDYVADWKRDQAEIDGIKKLAVARLDSFSRAGKWRWIYQRADSVFRHGSAYFGRPIDLLYLDGQHNAHDVLTEFVLIFPFLRAGSAVIFDDLGIGQKQQRRDCIPRVPVAVDAILSAFRLFVERIDTGGKYQAAVRIKREPKVGELLNHEEYEEYCGPPAVRGRKNQ